MSSKNFTEKEYNKIVISKKKFAENNSGFTLVELLLVVILIGALLAIIISAYSGVNAKNRNAQRQKNISIIQKDLEIYYAYNGVYPTLSEMNNSVWLGNNMKYLDRSILMDPNAKNNIISALPVKNQYSYTVTSPTGKICNNIAVKCGQYILTAELEGGGKFTASSLN